ncbi:hypothetical protein AAFC00_005450 [Neodothiora populina]
MLRKRKYSEIAPSVLDTPLPYSESSFPRTFIITTALSSSSLSDHVEKQTFHSLLCLPRTHLPLTFLDTFSTPQRLFTSRTPLLPSGHNQAILIVHQDGEPDGPFFAVERFKGEGYVMCKICKRVTLNRLRACSSTGTSKSGENGDYIGGYMDAYGGQMEQNGRATEWWQNCLASRSVSIAPKSSSPTSLSHRLPSRKAPRLHMHPPPFSSVDKLPNTSPDDAKDDAALVVTEGPLANAEPAVTSAEDVFTRFISQYLDTLYLSRTPLAFFAKGPVSRARAAFTSAQVDSATLSDLVDFLRGMVHSSSVADKKYRDKLPEMLKGLSPRDAAIEDVSSRSKSKEKKKRKKRCKPDKYGLLPDEEEHFAKWWNGDEASAPVDETAEQSLGRRGARLRTRETFMQLVLVLEVLSLEATPEMSQAVMTAEAQSSTQPQLEDSQTAKAGKKKVKKSNDLVVLLELLLDKLSIWHSLDSVEENSKPDKVKDGSPDELRNFCVEVIIPFYLSRIPVHAANVNKKLGGPSSATAATGAATSSTNKASRTSISTKKAKKPLHRVATETAANASLGGRLPSVLSRSSTDPQALSNLIKREPSATPSLSSITSYRRDSQSSNAPQSRRPSGVQQLRAREVDFTALSAANEAKTKKRAEVEGKLRDAISTLKRPNRLAANKEIADVAEQRRLMANARARAGIQRTRSKSDDKSKNQANSQIHVAATPRDGHKIDRSIAATPHRIAAPSFTQPSYPNPVLPSSGPACIPSSAIRPPPALLEPSSPSRPCTQPHAAYAEVEEDTLVPATGRRQRVVRYELTPSKPVEMTRNDSDADQISGDDSPTNLRALSSTGGKFSMHGTKHSVDNVDDEDDDDEGLPIFQTPSKPSRTFVAQITPSRSYSSKRGDQHGSSVFSNTDFREGKGKVFCFEAGPDQSVIPNTTNIYDTLGWNDDDELSG